MENDKQSEQPAPDEKKSALGLLSPKVQLFVLYLSADPKRNGTKAVQKVWKQTDGAAAVTASRLLKKAKVKAALDEELAKQLEPIRKDGEYIVRRMLEAECIDLNLLYNENFELKPMSEWPAGYSTLVEGLRITLEPQLDLFKRGTDGKPSMIQNIELKVPSRKAMWELLGRHFGIFKDSIEVNLKGDLAQRLANARKRVQR